MNAPVTQSGKKVLVQGRLSYPDLFKSRPGLQRDDGTPGDPKFGCHIIIDPNSPDAAALKAALMEVATQKWGANAANVITAMEGSKKCLRNGNTNLARDGTVRGGYQGHLFLVARSKVAPLVLADKFNQGKPVRVTEDGRAWQPNPKTGVLEVVPVQWKVTAPYGGCYVKAQVEVYAMEGVGAKAQQGRSINATLLAVQFVKDGEAFGGSRADESDFSEVGGPPPGTDSMGADPFETDIASAPAAAPSDPFQM